MLDHFLRVIRREDKIHNGTNDARGVAFDASLNERIKAILREHDVAEAGIMLEQSHSAKAPLGILPLVEQIIRIECLVSAMKTAYSNVHDGLADFLPIISRHLNFWIQLT